MHVDKEPNHSVSSNDSAFLKWYNKENSKLEAKNKELAKENVRLTEENVRLIQI